MASHLISSFFLKRKKSGKDKLAPSPLGALGTRVPLASNASIVSSDVSQTEWTSLQDDVASENLEKFDIAPTVVPVNEPEATSSSKVLYFLYLLACIVSLLQFEYGKY
jgi:hypothetical protein